MDYVVQYVGGVGREKYLDAMRAQIPNIIVVEDKDKNQYLPEYGCKSSMLAFLQSINRNEPFFRFEDDALLCKDFVHKANKLVDVYPDVLHQFFSMRRSDYEAGSRFVAGYKFMCAVGLYFPKGMGTALFNYYSGWKNTKSGLENPTGFDTMIRDYLKDNHLNYYVNIPCLVQHACEKSAINPKRSSKRQTMLFVDDFQ